MEGSFGEKSRTLALPLLHLCHLDKCGNCYLFLFYPSIIALILSKYLSEIISQCGQNFAVVLEYFRRKPNHLCCFCLLSAPHVQLHCQIWQL